MLLNIFPILKDHLSEPLILIAIEDITEIRTANVMLQFNNKQLKESNKELSSYCYIASHDMQEPLRKIHSFSKLILDDKNSKLSGEANKYMDRIVVSIRRMQQLTDDLLNYSNVGNALEEDFENTDLQLLLADVLEELKEVIQTKNAIIEVSELPVLKALPLLMRQLFINLLVVYLNV